MFLIINPALVNNYKTMYSDDVLYWRNCWIDQSIYDIQIIDLINCRTYQDWTKQNEIVSHMRYIIPKSWTKKTNVFFSVVVGLYWLTYFLNNLNFSIKSYEWSNKDKPLPVAYIRYTKYAIRWIRKYITIISFNWRWNGNVKYGICVMCVWYYEWHITINIIGWLHHSPFDNKSFLDRVHVVIHCGKRDGQRKERVRGQ